MVENKSNNKEDKLCSKCGENPRKIYSTGYVASWCSSCLNAGKSAYARTDKAKENAKKYKETDNYKAYIKKYHESEGYKQTQINYRNSDKGKAILKECRYRQQLKDRMEEDSVVRDLGTTRSQAISQLRADIDISSLWEKVKSKTA